MDVKAGIIQGREHRRALKNCQDAFYLLEGKLKGDPITIGVIADGCGSSAKSEIGANLAVQFCAYEARKLAGLVELNQIPNILFQRLIGYLRSIVQASDILDPREQILYVRENLLFTLLGLVVYQGHAVVFALGDGIVVMNEEIDVRVENNQPNYIAYHILPESALSDPDLPSEFDVYEFVLEELSCLAIGSDSWIDEIDLLDEFWNLGENKLAMQRKLRVLSNDKNKHFQDDTVLITVEF